jgi:hypothetical protein
MRVLVGWVGIIEPEIAKSFVMTGCLKVQPDCFQVAEVQVAVWLRRESEDFSATMQKLVRVFHARRVELDWQLPSFKFINFLPGEGRTLPSKFKHMINE